MASLTQHLVLPAEGYSKLQTGGLGAVWIGVGPRLITGGRKPCVLPSAQTRPGGLSLLPPPGYPGQKRPSPTSERRQDCRQL